MTKIYVVYRTLYTTRLAFCGAFHSRLDAEDAVRELTATLRPTTLPLRLGFEIDEQLLGEYSPDGRQMIEGRW